MLLTLNFLIAIMLTPVGQWFLSELALAVTLGTIVGGLNAMECNGMQWNAMECNGMQWNAIHHAADRGAIKTNAVRFIVSRKANL